MKLLLLLAVLGAWLLCAHALVAPHVRSALVLRKLHVTNAYVPDGLSKEQYEALRRKEEEDAKKLKLGAIGITKFQSRSFEAWQKGGGKNLFPVDPNSPEYVKPYMQRKGGSADGTDLIKKGIKITQLKAGAAPQAKSAVDLKYEQLEAKGLTRSSPFELPWSNAQTAKLAQASSKLTEAQKASQLKKKAAGPTKVPMPPPEAPAKKGLFGLW